jgi:acetyl esterase/lipase
MRRTRIPYGPGHGQVGDLWLPSKTTGVVPLVVLIHGGFWRAQYTKTLMNRLARAVARRGWAAWNIEYRRVGALGGGGGWPATFQDVADAIDHVARRSPPSIAGRVVTCGHSAGGTLALWAAGRGRLPDGAPGSAGESGRPGGRSHWPAWLIWPPPTRRAWAGTRWPSSSAEARPKSPSASP